MEDENETQAASTTNGAAAARQRTPEIEVPKASAAYEDSEPVHVGRLTRTVVKYPCLVMWALFTVIMMLSILVAIAEIAPADSVFDVLGFPSFSPKFEPVVLRGLGTGEVQQDVYDPDEDDEDDRRRRRLDDDDDDELEREFTLSTIRLYYEDLEGDNLLTEENVLKMIDVERAILETDWENVCKTVWDFDEKKFKCAQPRTILNYLFENDKKHKELCEDGFCVVDEDDVKSCSGSVNVNGTKFATGLSFGKWPCVSTAFDWRDGTLANPKDWSKLLDKSLCDRGSDTKYFLDKDNEECKKPIMTKFSRAQYDIGCPRPGFKRCDEDRGAQNGELEGGLLGQGQYGRDLLAALSVQVDKHSATAQASTTTARGPQGDRTINIFFDASLTGRQADLGLYTAMTSIASLVFVFFYIWANVGSLFLAFVGVFEILMSLPLAWFIWRLILWQQLLDFFSVFLLPFLIICIGADDIFVFMDTWKASASKPPSISGTTETRLVWTYKTAASAMFTTTATTVLALCMTATSSIPFIATFGVKGALVVLMDYVLVISWFPTTVIVYHTYIEHATCCKWWCGCLPTCRPVDVTPGEPVPERKSVQLLREKAAPQIYKYRYAMLTIAMAAIVSFCAVFGSLYEVAQDFPSFYVDAHPRNAVEVITDTKFFVAADWKHQITVVYGLDPDKPVTRDETGQLVPDIFEEEDLKVNYYNLNLNENMQKQLVKDCADLRKNEDLVSKKEVYCILNDLEEWAGDDFPYENEEELRKGLADFYDSGDYGRLQGNFSDYGRLTNFVPDGTRGIKAIWNSFNATIPQEATSGPASIGPWQEAWYTYINETCAAPCFAHMNNPPVSEPINWEFMTIIQITVREVWSTMGYSLLCAFIVLMFTTWNVIVSGYVVLTITCIMVCVVGSVFAIGNNLSIFECTLIALTIGLAIDYSVHIAHFYVHAGGTRFERTQESLAEIGISVFGGAATTVFAGVPLFSASERFTSLFGFFILFTAMWSLFLTFFLLVPLLMIIGPEGTQGDMKRYLPERFRGKSTH